MKNNSKMKSIISIILCLAAVACIFAACHTGNGALGDEQNTESAEETERFSTTNVSRGYKKLEEGEEPHSYVADDGNTYYIEKNGELFYIPEDDKYSIYGIQSLVEEYVNISPARTYEVNYQNGARSSFTINKDGTYDYVNTYPDGSYQTITGRAEVQNGFDNALEALGAASRDVIYDGFKMHPASLNPNNLYHISLIVDDDSVVKNFDESGKEIVYNGPMEDYGEEFIEDEGADELFVVDEFVLYLTQDGGTIIEEDTGREGFNVRVQAAQSTLYGLLFSEWSVNGEMSCSGIRYLDETK